MYSATSGALLCFQHLPRRCGLLCVGLAGNNGVTLVAGQLAIQQDLTWESSRDGPKEAKSCASLGCITQVGALARAHPERSQVVLAVARVHRRGRLRSLQDDGGVGRDVGRRRLRQ